MIAQRPARTAAATVTLAVAMCLAAIHGGSAGASEPVLEIWEIQGSGPASPYAQQRITTRGNIVTAVAGKGFFMQTPASRSDGDAGTSDGVFVYTGAPPAVAAGDRVDVTGTVQEFHELTEIGSSPVVTVTGGGLLPPPAVQFGPSVPDPATPPAEAALERFEGMLVEVSSATVTGPTDLHGNFTIVARADRAFREPGIRFPGLPGLPVWDGNPEIIEVDPDGLDLPGLEAAGGDTVSDILGPLTFSFGSYQIQAAQLTRRPAPLPVPVRVSAPGEMTVATQNLFRLYDEVDDPATDDPAPSPDEVGHRLGKASAWIRDVLGAPDLLAVQEVENLPILQRLADRIHADDPAVTYTPYLVEGNDISGIDVGLLVRSTVAVDMLRQIAAGESFSYDGRSFTLYDRPPLLARVSYAGNGEPFPLTVMTVHLRSLNGIDGANAGFVREKRFQQALRLSREIQSIQESEPGVRLLVLGDFNANPFTDGYVDVMGQVTGRPDPLGALLPASDEVEPDLFDASGLLVAAERYSFVLEGTAEELDHILVSAALHTFVRGAAFGRGNADAPASWADDPATPLRTSDHDGLVLYLMTDHDGDGLPDDRELPPTPARRTGRRLRPARTSAAIQ